jgi:hypothetical protein
LINLRSQTKKFLTRQKPLLEKEWLFSFYTLSSFHCLYLNYPTN